MTFAKIWIAVCAVFFSFNKLTAAVVSFGSGVNSFSIEFVTIGNPGNPDDTTGNPNPAGGVAYSFDIAKYEVSEQMIEKANATAGLEISKSNRSPNKAASSISWNEAARFVNWLNESKGYSPAYKFAFAPGHPDYSVSSNIQLWADGDAGYNASNPFRNSNARFFLPDVDEWYKAAYYDPNQGGAGVGGYWNYATGGDTLPTPVASGIAAGTAVYNQTDAAAAPADIDNAGGLSPFGTMAQGGNVSEWMETENDLVNNAANGSRMQRGGHWGQLFNDDLSVATRAGAGPAVNTNTRGFRVAATTIPEPSAAMLATIVLGLGLSGRRIATTHRPRRHSA
jgi:formylglycine-generating enzyme